MLGCFCCGAHKPSAQQHPVGLPAILHATPLVDKGASGLHRNDAVSMRRRKESEHEVRAPCACLCLCSSIAPDGLCTRQLLHVCVRAAS